MFKMMICGRRRPGMTFAAMRAYALEVHAPIVLGDPGFVEKFIGRYTQNHVLDSISGVNALYGRDIVAEVTMSDPSLALELFTDEYMATVVRPDEANFTHLTDVLPLMARETEVIAPPPPKGGAEESDVFKAIHYLKRAPDITVEQFAAAWEAIDLGTFAPRLKGYVRTDLLDGPLGPPPYDGVSSLWADRGDGDQLVADWLDVVDSVGFADPDQSFVLLVAEHGLREG